MPSLKLMNSKKQPPEVFCEKGVVTNFTGLQLY